MIKLEIDSHTCFVCRKSSNFILLGHKSLEKNAMENKG